MAVVATIVSMLAVATVETVSSHRIKIKLMLVYRYDKTLHMGYAGQYERVGGGGSLKFIFIDFYWQT